MRHQALVPERMVIVRTSVTPLEDVGGIGHIAAKQEQPLSKPSGRGSLGPPANRSSWAPTSAETEG
jgi:hypothetical protein